VNILTIVADFSVTSMSTMTEYKDSSILEDTTDALHGAKQL